MVCDDAMLPYIYSVLDEFIVSGFFLLFYIKMIHTYMYKIVCKIVQVGILVTANDI